MSDVKHTDTPWRFHAQGDANHYCLLGPDNQWVIAFMQNGEMRTVKQEANAEFIVRACNSHDDLVNALRDLIGWMPGREAWHTDAPIEAVERARNALIKAGAA